MALCADCHEARAAIYFDCSREPELWRAIEADALQEFTEAYAGLRPRLWWLHSAPDLRQIVGGFEFTDGAGRCHPTGVPHGNPANWNDPPLVESTPAYLDRHSLWLPSERQRVPARCFSPDVFDSTLTVEPRMPVDDCEDRA